MNTLLANASIVDIWLDRKLQYEFFKLKANVQLWSIYRTQIAKQTAGQYTNVSTAHSLVGNTTLARGPYTSTHTGGKNVGPQADPQRDYHEH